MVLFDKVKKRLFKRKFRKLNAHNDMWAVNSFVLRQVEIGEKSWGGCLVINYDATHTTKLKIGSLCSIASEVKFVLGGNHRTDRISTYLFKQSGIISNENYDENIQDKGDIIVEDDVWIGYDALILPGSHIGRGCVIGARSVVSGDVPPYSVYIGKSIYKRRFSDEMITALMNIDYKKLCYILDTNPKMVEEYFYKDPVMSDILKLQQIIHDMN